MKIDWSPLRTELQYWRKSGLELPIWWRDDDAIEPSQNLDKLNTLSDEVGVPVHLAIIPRNLKSELAPYLKVETSFVPVVHGWSHTDHQKGDGPKNEFGSDRSLTDRREEAEQGLKVLQARFGDRAAPMFVPPWNRSSEDFVAELPSLGYRAYSTCNPRLTANPVAGLTQINTHIDPLYWRPAKRLSDPSRLADKTWRLLRRRRRGKSDATEPFGLLTHHLAHFPEVWEFCRQYWLELQEGPVSIFSMDQLEATGKT